MVCNCEKYGNVTQRAIPVTQISVNIIEIKTRENYCKFPVKI